MEDWDAYGFVRSSSHRKKIVEELSKSPEVPSALADKLDMRVPHVSSALSDLVEKEVLECVNPERKKGRVYKLTEKGEWVVSKL